MISGHYAFAEDDTPQSQQYWYWNSCRARPLASFSMKIDWVRCSWDRLCSQIRRSFLLESSICRVKNERSTKYARLAECELMKFKVQHNDHKNDTEWTLRSAVQVCHILTSRNLSCTVQWIALAGLQVMSVEAGTTKAYSSEALFQAVTYSSITWNQVQLSATLFACIGSHKWSCVTTHSAAVAERSDHHSCEMPSTSIYIRDTLATTRANILENQELHHTSTISLTHDSRLHWWTTLMFTTEMLVKFHPHIHPVFFCSLGLQLPFSHQLQNG